ncbi:DUF3142 domain-containing protein [Novosphingobium sp.]|uniref:DUF3142 domain-containing protein n=2 Tax=unclassified Novosphingobium TaxID=2644732 RepID=UPI002C839827|nr:DUF3142 domain-containing protein [Novosphingobium sp.]HQV04818.1 DUF3142 domain-containing protein [Novosphingobium sp.]
MRWLASLALLLLASCTPAPPERVEAERYDAFFLWAGVRPQPVLERAKTLYLLAGEVRRDGRYHPLRATPRVDHGEVWLVVRAQSLDWPPATRQRIIDELARWQGAGNRLAGLQIDFDASTRGLEHYAVFLKDLRGQLDPSLRLSITGLMDWSANADPAALAALKGTVNEVVVQSYQGRTTIPGYERYLARLARVPVPHKVALVQGGEWREPAALAADPLFRGYVVFLVNPG